MVDYLSVSINVFHSLKAVTMQRGKLNISQFFFCLFGGGGGGEGISIWLFFIQKPFFFQQKNEMAGFFGLH